MPFLSPMDLPAILRMRAAQALEEGQFQLLKDLAALLLTLELDDAVRQSAAAAKALADIDWTKRAWNAEMPLEETLCRCGVKIGRFDSADPQARWRHLGGTRDGHAAVPAAEPFYEVPGPSSGFSFGRAWWADGHGVKQTWDSEFGCGVLCECGMPFDGYGSVEGAMVALDAHVKAYAVKAPPTWENADRCTCGAGPDEPCKPLTRDV